MIDRVVMLHIAGLEERIEYRERDLAAARSESAALRAELAAARECGAIPVPYDDGTKPERPLAIAAWRERTTVRIPSETMDQVIDGRLR